MGEIFSCMAVGPGARLEGREDPEELSAFRVMGGAEDEIPVSAATCRPGHAFFEESWPNLISIGALFNGTRRLASPDLAWAWPQNVSWPV